LTLPDAQALDAQDIFKSHRSRFALADGLIYLDGNSLGPPLADMAARMAQLTRDEWGGKLIGGWTQSGWMDLPERTGAQIAPLIGAAADEVIAGDSTTILLFKLAAAALAQAPSPRLLTDAANFPTNLHLLEGLKSRFPALQIITAPAGPDGAALDQTILDLLAPGTGLLFLTHVDYKTGRRRDLPGLSAAAKAAGALSLWDLSHSAGALALDLNAAGTDFAVGCGYKFLNSGPGAPAWAFAARKHHGTLTNPIPGWMGHQDPFAFDGSWRPAPGMRGLMSGTPQVLGLSALQHALAVFDGVDLAALDQKAGALGDRLIQAVGAQGLSRLRLISPRLSHQRGAQVSYAVPDAAAIAARLEGLGVIADVRPPGILRFGLAPLYLTFAEMDEAARRLAQALSP